MSKPNTDQTDARKARLSDTVLLDVFMRRRKHCLEHGYSLVAASNEAHQAVDEVQKRNAPPVILSAADREKAIRNSRKWQSEI